MSTIAHIDDEVPGVIVTYSSGKIGYLGAKDLNTPIPLGVNAADEVLAGYGWHRTGPWLKPYRMNYCAEVDQDHAGNPR